ncbi:MAG: hypothetical protein VXZ72_04365 [Chlamydiota bacterium]|nr:hypothetical protein [Chlamydiota bacterium]
MKVTRSFIRYFSACVWLGIGALLVTRGAAYLLLALKDEESLLRQSAAHYHYAPLTGVIVISFMAFVLGTIKGQCAIKKRVYRMETQMLKLPYHFSFFQIYGLTAFLLVGLMMGLGMMVRWMPIPYEVKALLVVAVGTSLIQGGFTFLFGKRPKKVPH